MNAHCCHALRCSTPVAPRLFMCPAHWRRLPAHHKAAIWKHYRRGQEKTKDPSPQYMLAQTEAVLAMGIIDGVDAGALRIQRGWVNYWKRVVSGEEPRKESP